jgi:murein DD-endopeptidase MepM/ murein hydrolase activator NlpD
VSRHRAVDRPMTTEPAPGDPAPTATPRHAAAAGPAPAAQARAETPAPGPASRPARHRAAFSPAPQLHDTLSAPTAAPVVGSVFGPEAGSEPEAREPALEPVLTAMFDAPTLVLPVIAAEDLGPFVAPRGPRRRGGRRAAPKPRGRVTASAAFGGAAVLLAAFGAVALSQPSSQAATQLRPTAQHGHEPSDSLYSRSLPMSGGGSRAALETVAEREAAARGAQLASAESAAKTYAKTLASQQWVLPTSGFHISTWFGEPGPYWATGYHTGIDFATACGTPEVAVSAGVVAQSGWDGPYGNQVRLQLPNGDQVWYNHMVAIKTHLGAHVPQGGLIGLVGETGNAYGCHLHFEYRLAADLKLAVNPYPFFLAHGIQLNAPQRYR